MSATWDKEISLRKLREDHHTAYCVLAVSAWVVTGSLLFLFFLLVFSVLNPWLHAGVIISGSMEPTIGTGSLVIVTPQEEYHQGEIISFSNPAAGRTVHRIVGETTRDGETFYITKGDANNVLDDFLVPTDEIEGKVVLIFPYLGYAAYLGFFALLIPLILLVLYLIRKRRAKSVGDERG